MASCAAYNCNNKIGQNLENITFHRFPTTKPDQLSRWLRAMHKEKWHPTKSDIICSQHFTDDQFVDISGYRFLIYNATPSKFEVLATPKTLFPEEWSAKLLSIKDIECENRNGYVVEARIPLQNKEEFNDWLKEHEKLSQVSYVLLRNYPTTTKNLSFKAEYVCRQGSSSLPPGQKPCPARLLVRIRTDTKFRFKKPEGAVASYPCTIVLYHLHNHHVGSNQMETQLGTSEEVSTVVKQKFVEMFKGGYDVEQALDMHRKDLLEEYTDEYEEVLNDPYVCPNTDWLNLFHGSFVEEFGEWNRDKLMSLLREEMEDINASKGKAAIKEVGEHTVVALCTALMQRSHSLKASGEIVFVDSSRRIEACQCYVYILMTYSCTEGLPLGVIITTSDAEDVLTASFELLAEILPEKAFGQFGRQGPEVFLTANDEAQQNSLKVVYPDAAVMLCSYSMSQALWRWLWDPQNEIQEEDRCTLFSLTYKLMKTKNVDEFTEQTDIILSHEIIQKYDNFRTYLETIKSLSERWAMCIKNEILDKDKEVSAIEVASHVLKDKVFLTKAYNILQLVKYFTDTMETYYRQKIIHSINNTLESFLLSSFKPEDDWSLEEVPSGQCRLTNSKSNHSYYVDLSISVCSCALGSNGVRCKHLYTVGSIKQEVFVSSVPDDDIIKKELFWIGTDTATPENYSDSESEVLKDSNAFLKQKHEARKILVRVIKSIMEKYDSHPIEFHQAIVTAAVNYQNLNNDREIISALKNFGKSLK